MKDLQRIGYRLREKMILPVKKIISGGQTGVDQAALDCAIALEMEYGGWLPPRRMTETGALPKRYVMQVMDRGGYPERTRKNVDVSNGTLTLNADGTFSYTHDGSENLTDSFTYIVSDEDGGVTDTGTVSITVNPVIVMPIPTWCVLGVTGCKSIDQLIFKPLRTLRNLELGIRN